MTEEELKKLEELFKDHPATTNGTEGFLEGKNLLEWVIQEKNNAKMDLGWELINRASRHAMPLLIAEVRRLRETLRFYAEAKVYYWNDTPVIAVTGERASKALGDMQGGIVIPPIGSSLAATKALEEGK